MEKKQNTNTETQMNLCTVKWAQWDKTQTYSVKQRYKTYMYSMVPQNVCVSEPSWIDSLQSPKSVNFTWPNGNQHQLIITLQWNRLFSCVLFYMPNTIYYNIIYNTVHDSIKCNSQPTMFENENSLTVPNYLINLYENAFPNYKATSNSPVIWFTAQFQDPTKSSLRW